MSELQSLIKKLNVAAVATKSYIYYEKETGKINKVSSRDIFEEGFEIFEIDTEEVKPILTGERRTEEFTITYDVSSKQIRLKEIAYDDSYNTAATLTYQLPLIKNTNDGHFILTEAYSGVDVCIFDKTKNYIKGQFIWHDNNVYKLSKDIIRNIKFNSNDHNLFIENVVLTTLPTQTHQSNIVTFNNEYVGVHVDVWYKELSHLAGQHVWLNGNVYKLLTDQDADTEFTMDNVEVIVKDVKLYNDENKNLEFNNVLLPGDMILDNNKLYSVKIKTEEFTKDKYSVFFYNSVDTALYVDNQKYLEISLNSTNKIVNNSDIKLELTDPSDLKNGRLVLSGKTLYQIEKNKDYDVIISQDTINKTWSAIINPYTKKFLKTSGYNPKERLYFSVTSKHDPNILYRSLEFTIDDLLNDHASIIPFIYDTENDSDDVSIYTVKYFENYAHEVI